MFREVNGIKVEVFQTGATWITSEKRILLPPGGVLTSGRLVWKPHLICDDCGNDVELSRHRYCSCGADQGDF